MLPASRLASGQNLSSRHLCLFLRLGGTGANRGVGSQGKREKESSTTKKSAVLSTVSLVRSPVRGFSFMRRRDGTVVVNGMKEDGFFKLQAEAYGRADLTCELCGVPVDRDRMEAHMVRFHGRKSGEIDYACKGDD